MTTSLDTLLKIQEDQSQREELAEAFLADVMGQLNSLDPTHDGDELVTMMRDTIEDGPDSWGAGLWSYLLGCPLHEWIEEFETE